MEQKKTFGETIKGLRKLHNLTLKQSSIKLGIDLSTLSKIEKNKRSPNKKLISKLAQLYKFPEKELIVSHLSDKVVYEISDQEFANDALKIAEQKINQINKE